MSGDHVWFKPDFLPYECCKNCGTIRRADGGNRPCKGKVVVGLRGAAGTSGQADDSASAHQTTGKGLDDDAG